MKTTEERVHSIFAKAEAVQQIEKQKRRRRLQATGGLLLVAALLGIFVLPNYLNRQQDAAQTPDANIAQLDQAPAPAGEDKLEGAVLPDRTEMAEAPAAGENADELIEEPVTSQEEFFLAELPKDDSGDIAVSRNMEMAADMDMRMDSDQETTQEVAVSAPSIVDIANQTFKSQGPPKADRLLSRTYKQEYVSRQGLKVTIYAGDSQSDMSSYIEGAPLELDDADDRLGYQVYNVQSGDTAYVYYVNDSANEQLVFVSSDLSNEELENFVDEYLRLLED